MTSGDAGVAFSITMDVGDQKLPWSWLWVRSSSVHSKALQLSTLLSAHACPGIPGMVLTTACA